jgi:hypothetical protein
LGLLAVVASYLLVALEHPLGLLVLAYHQSYLALVVHFASFRLVLVGSFDLLDLFADHRILLDQIGIDLVFYFVVFPSCFSLGY